MCASKMGIAFGYGLFLLQSGLKTIQFLTVTGSGSDGKCGRLNQPGWFLNTL